MQPSPPPGSDHSAKIENNWSSQTQTWRCPVTKINIRTTALERSVAKTSGMKRDVLNEFYNREIFFWAQMLFRTHKFVRFAFT